MFNDTRQVLDVKASDSPFEFIKKDVDTFIIICDKTGYGGYGGHKGGNNENEYFMRDYDLFGDRPYYHYEYVRIHRIVRFNENEYMCELSYDGEGVTLQMSFDEGNK